MINDRAQAGGSVNEGEISFLIYRRLASFSDNRNEEDLIEKKLALKHYLFFNDDIYFRSKTRLFLKELEKPCLMFAGSSSSINFSGKKFKIIKKLQKICKIFYRIDEMVMLEMPKNLRFSFKLFKTKELLIFLQNIDDFENLNLKFEKENNEFINKILKRKINIKNIVEMNLAGNQYLMQSEKYKLKWSGKGNEHDANLVGTFKEKQQLIKQQIENMDDETFIKIKPLEIRVFMLSFD